MYLKKHIYQPFQIHETDGASMINAQTGDPSRQDPDSYLNGCCSVRGVSFQGLVAVTLRDRSI